MTLAYTEILNSIITIAKESKKAKTADQLYNLAYGIVELATYLQHNINYDFCDKNGEVNYAAKL